VPARTCRLLARAAGVRERHGSVSGDGCTLCPTCCPTLGAMCHSIPVCTGTQVLTRADATTGCPLSCPTCIEKSSIVQYGSSSSGPAPASAPEAFPCPPAPAACSRVAKTCKTGYALTSVSGDGCKLCPTCCKSFATMCKAVPQCTGTQLLSHSDAITGCPLSCPVCVDASSIDQYRESAPEPAPAPQTGKPATATSAVLALGAVVSAIIAVCL